MNANSRAKAPASPRRGAALLAVVALATTEAGAEPPRWVPGNEVTSRPKAALSRSPASDTEGGYGRFGGDLDFGLGLGAEFARGGPRAAVRGTLHYFSTAGLYFTYRDALGSDSSTGSARVFSGGVDLRPAFIPRWAQDMQQGPSFLDLALDSISLGMGAYWQQPRGRDFGDERGFELSLGFGVPLLARATGPWLETRTQLAFADTETARAQCLLLLSFHALAVSPLARTD